MGRAHVAVALALIAAGCSIDHVEVESAPDKAARIREDAAAMSASFTPKSEVPTGSPTIQKAREIFASIDREGFEIAIKGEPVPGYAGWLVYDPALAEEGHAVNWVVSNDGRLPESVDAMKLVMAMYRAGARTHGRIQLDILDNGSIVDKASGRELGATASAFTNKSSQFQRTPDAVTLPDIGEVRRIELARPRP